jgi:multicomponent Na+:H+ antiporter subunit F
MTIFAWVAIAIILIGMANLLRLGLGPTVFDRVLALSAFGSSSIALIALGGFIFGRPGLFVDVAIAYSLLNFIGTVVLSKYLEQRREP